MAKARPANASVDDALISLVRALLFKSLKKKEVYCEVASCVRLEVNATALAFLATQRLSVSEPTARRAVKELIRLQLLDSKKGLPVFLTPLGKKVFGGVLE